MLLTEYNEAKQMELVKEEGRQEGRTEGRLETLLATAKNLMKRFGWSKDEAKDFMEVSEEEWNSVSSRL